MRSHATIDKGLTNVLSTGIDAPNAQFPIAESNDSQLALAVAGGYRGRFTWPTQTESESSRDGLYVAANYNYLRGFWYTADNMAIRFVTDTTGSIVNTSDVSIGHRTTRSGSGLALDLGFAGVVQRWQAGFAIAGIANRMNWKDVEATTFTLSSLTSGNGSFAKTTTETIGDVRVTLPVDYRGNISYNAASWTAAAEAGHGLGGTSLHSGLERRFRKVEIRGGARYTVSKWNPTGGVGVNISRSVSVDVAAFGTNANIERKRQLTIAASIRLNRVQ